MDGTTHVMHMAAVKEDPAHAIDVAVKGMFLLVEAFRQNKDAMQVILIGGDCSVGHCIVKYDEPVDETSPRRGYPGVYALTKILEEVMLEMMYELPSMPGLKECIVTREVILNRERPVLVSEP